LNITRIKLYLLKGTLSPLRINLGKSEIVPVGEVKDVDNMTHSLSADDLFGFAVGSVF